MPLRSLDLFAKPKYACRSSTKSLRARIALASGAGPTPRFNRFPFCGAGGRHRSIAIAGNRVGPAARTPEPAPFSFLPPSTARGSPPTSVSTFFPLFLGRPWNSHAHGVDQASSSVVEVGWIGVDAAAQTFVGEQSGLVKVCAVVRRAARCSVPTWRPAALLRWWC